MPYTNKGKMENLNISSEIDNSLLFFYRSKSDFHLGLPDYLYYKILGISPVMFYNIYDFEASDSDIELEDKEYQKYETRLTDGLKNNINNFIEYFLEEHKDSNLFYIDKLTGKKLPLSEKYNARMITKEIFKFTKGVNKK